MMTLDDLAYNFFEEAELNTEERMKNFLSDAPTLAEFISKIVKGFLIRGGVDEEVFSINLLTCSAEEAEKVEKEFAKFVEKYLVEEE